MLHQVEDEQDRKNRIKLQKVWYKKLKDEGFVDLEILAPDGEMFDTLRFSRQYDYREDYTKYIDIQEYYRAARQFYHDFKFPNDLIKQIWFYYSEGIPYRQIIKLIPNIRYYKVFYWIRKLKRILFAEAYGRKEILVIKTKRHTPKRIAHNGSRGKKVRRKKRKTNKNRTSNSN